MKEVLTANGTREKRGLNDVDTRFIKLVARAFTPRTTFSQNVGMLKTKINENDIDGKPGITSADIKLVKNRYAEHIRTKGLISFNAMDADNDGFISLGEAENHYGEVASKMRVETFGEDKNQPLPETYDPKRKSTKFFDRMDINRDLLVSLPEHNLATEDLVLLRRTNTDYPDYVPSLVADRNHDKILSEEEIIYAARQVFEWLDQDGDGRVSRAERNAEETLRRPPYFFATQKTKIERSRKNCQLDTIESGADVIVINGYEGAASTDIGFNHLDKPVDLIDVRIPDGADVTLLVNIHRPHILRLDNPTARPVHVVQMNGDQAGLIADKSTKLTANPPYCFFNFWKGTSDRSDLLEQEIRRVFTGASVNLRFISDYTLGTVDLATLSNQSRLRFFDAVELDHFGPNGPLWVHFSRLNPGGLVLLDPDDIRSSAWLSNSELWPAFAGLGQLADSGFLELTDRGYRFDTKTGQRLSVVIDKKRYKPGSGDDALHRNGLLYTYKHEGSWVGREKLELKVLRNISLPLGLTGANQVKFIIPDNLSAPSAVHHHNEFVRE